MAKKTAGKKKITPKTKKEIYSEEELQMIREKQLELALAGDRQMLIWLGKSVLGQKPAVSRTEREEETKYGGPLELTPDEEAAVFGG